ncbi:hypothetical protein Bhyg_03040 [Pseudolycoriella hygida]|uniref:Uncharacterized protein n=1 Tax=Pseudolycoriella hygida TaxID=35572 RepID=A0A9Q0NDC6_9DIPT|nr:hypothetical protein Bhyg_03040 [Pseudolycoriella hygida]
MNCSPKLSSSLDHFVPQEVKASGSVGQFGYGSKRTTPNPFSRQVLAVNRRSQDASEYGKSSWVARDALKGSLFSIFKSIRLFSRLLKIQMLRDKKSILSFYFDATTLKEILSISLTLILILILYLLCIRRDDYIHRA